MISPSVPHLKWEHRAGCSPAATFIAYFKCEEQQLADTPPSQPTKINDPGTFVPDGKNTSAAHRMVRVDFKGHYANRQNAAIGDHEVLPEDDFDWSLVASNLRGGESISEYQLRIDHMWKTSGLAPDPMMYEVKNSRWLANIGIHNETLHHFVLAGHDNYIEVLADSWHWTKGQPLSTPG